MRVDQNGRPAEGNWVAGGKTESTSWNTSQFSNRLEHQCVQLNIACWAFKEFTKHVGNKPTNTATN